MIQLLLLFICLGIIVYCCFYSVWYKNAYKFDKKSLVKMITFLGSIDVFDNLSNVTQYISNYNKNSFENVNYYIKERLRIQNCGSSLASKWWHTKKAIKFLSKNEKLFYAHFYKRGNSFYYDHKADHNKELIDIYNNLCNIHDPIIRKMLESWREENIHLFNIKEIKISKDMAIHDTIENEVNVQKQKIIDDVHAPIEIK